MTRSDREFLKDILPEWQPIDTAPQFDTEMIDIYAKGMRYTDCWWGRETYGKRIGWVHQGSYDSNGPVDEFIEGATHWMPLPAAPKES